MGAEGRWIDTTFWKGVLASFVASVLFLLASMLWNWLEGVPPLVVATCFIAVAYYGFSFWMQIANRSTVARASAPAPSIAAAVAPGTPAKKGPTKENADFVQTVYEIARTIETVCADRANASSQDSKRRWRTRALLLLSEYASVLNSDLLNRLAKDHLRNAGAADYQVLEFIGSDRLGEQNSRLHELLTEAKPKLLKVGEDFAKDHQVRWPPDQRIASK